MMMMMMMLYYVFYIDSMKISTLLVNILFSRLVGLFGYSWDNTRTVQGGDDVNMLLMGEKNNKDTHCSGRILEPDPCSIKPQLGLSAPLSPLRLLPDAHSSAGFPLLLPDPSHSAVFLSSLLLLLSTHPIPRHRLERSLSLSQRVARLGYNALFRWRGFLVEYFGTIIKLHTFYI